MAAAEFDIHPDTLSKRVKLAGVLPGEDDCYSTADIVAAIFGDYEAQRTRLTKEQADIAEIKRKILDKKYLPAEVMDSLMTQAIAAYRDFMVGTPIGTVVDQPFKETALGVLTGPTINDIISKADKLGQPEELGEDFEASSGS